jgi:hypothetical protein
MKKVSITGGAAHLGEALAWQPRYDFRAMLDSLTRTGRMPASEVSQIVGSKGYHDQQF